MAKLKRVFCPQCTQMNEYDPLRVRFRGMNTVVCTGCGSAFSPYQKGAGGLSDNQKRSRAQESHMARKIGGRVQPASGALGGAKGDVRKRGEARVECKHTRSRSFSLKLDELLKIQGEAAGAELPLFEVEFGGVHPAQRFIVLRSADFVALSEELKDLRRSR